IEDMVEQIGDDYVNVYNLVPTGTDPHEYEPLPEDIMEATDADVLFLNGMNLEGGQEGWFYKMIDSVDQDLDNVYKWNEGFEPKYLTDEDDEEEEINPHSLLNSHVGIIISEKIREALMENDANHAEEYIAYEEQFLDCLQKIGAK